MQAPAVTDACEAGHPGAMSSESLRNFHFCNVATEQTQFSL